jgi:hypothetical protein
VESHEPYIGVFATWGVGLAHCHPSVYGIPLGDVSLAAEIEVGYEWNNLGQYEHSATLLSVSPKLTLGFSF